MTQTLSRSQRAMQIERRTSRTWTVGTVGISIPSQTTAGRRYETTETTCSCADATYRGYLGISCKHQLALRLALGRYDATQ